MDLLQPSAGGHHARHIYSFPHRPGLSSVLLNVLQEVFMMSSTLYMMDPGEGGGGGGGGGQEAEALAAKGCQPGEV